MRPIYHAKADRLRAKAARLDELGARKLAELAGAKPRGARALQAGGRPLPDGPRAARTTRTRRPAWPRTGQITDGEIVAALTAVMRQDAFNHKDLQSIDGRLANGMSVMAMGAHTGCNTVYGSTPPNNPHPYPWMNSLFQDGVTISWLMGESFIMDHARRSVIPERLADALLDRGPRT